MFYFLQIFPRIVYLLLGYYFKRVSIALIRLKSPECTIDALRR